MRWRYDQRLIEAVVFEAMQHGISGCDSDISARYHRLIDPLYEITNTLKRERAFFDANWTSFVELACDQMFPEALKRYVHLSTQVPEGVVTRATSSREEQAELFDRDGDGLTLVVRVQANKFLEPQEMLTFIHHEMCHVDDLLDPSFDFQKSDLTDSNSRLSVRLIRDRYRVMWAIDIDGRLVHHGLTPLKSKDERYTELVQTFPFLDKPTIDAWFDKLWNDARLTHKELLELARRPREALDHETLSRQGLPCFLCGFLSHAWSKSQELPDSVQDQIRRDFPAWTHSDGVCERCAEIYCMIASKEVVKK